jgi:lipopolysaccharide biosynthesis glycosyltransferase
MRIASAADENYAWPYMVLLTQAVNEVKPLTTFALYHIRGLLSSNALQLISNLADSLGLRFESVEVEPHSAAFRNGHLSKTAFARFPMIENEESVFLYLDVDLLLRDGWGGVYQEAEKLSALESTTPSNSTDNDACAIAYQYGPIPYDKSNEAFVRCGDAYFNSGVMLLSPLRIKMLEGWRDKDFLIKNYERFGFQWSDQCVLNYILHGATLPLSAKWNYMGLEGTNSDEGPLIVHFAGTKKPWSEISLNKNPYVDDWKCHERTLLKSLVSNKLILRALPLIMRTYLKSLSELKRLPGHLLRRGAMKIKLILKASGRTKSQPSK